MSDDSETSIVPVIAGDLRSARSMRLRLRFHERELVLEDSPQSADQASCQALEARSAEPL